ncbi:diacylglycerol O-acyltransferase [Mycobacterium frederiksbergense]|uniref:Diacylglycerol O-acyltransferase n=1 Tax=Mycolicibacterium frederiksbergense TaxID=117567 RepID=A0ABT6KTH1_9MYCO|nr:wax ester/triacylglycerol synthase family O-acyltransferase [Mycolicibacterium frederiksbergense]MDH6194019.1 diacylglycerol O-acyltransferase [Mycolicibacterium frederiksbergense]
MDWLDPLDAAMITADVISNPLNIGAVLLISPPPDAGPGYIDDIYQDSLVGEAPIDPRFRRYPHRGMTSAGGWVWREVDAVDLRQHCKRSTLAPGAGRAGLWQLIGELHAQAFDRSRPMWLSYLIDGLDDGQFALYIKLHHTVMDGVAGLQMLTAVLSADSRQRSMPAFYADRRAEPDERSTGKGPRIANPLTLLRSAVATATSGVVLAERAIAGGAATALAGLTSDTTVLPVAAPYVRFNGRLGRDRDVTAGSWPKARFQTLAKIADTTTNDVVTAVIAGVLRQWLLDHGELPQRSLVAICPITVHGRQLVQSEQRGNMFGAWLCPLGTDVVDPVERLDLIHRSMYEGKHHVATRGAAASMLLLATSIVPTVLLPMLPWSPRIGAGYNLPISHVPGPQTEMYWNGAHVDEIYPISTVYDGQALNVTTCSYADRIGFGYIAGGEMFSDIAELIARTEQALMELEAAVGVT